MGRLPESLKLEGLFGSMVTLVMVELRSYAPVFLGQRGDRSSFSMLGLTLYGSRFLWDFRGRLRWVFGLGMSLDSRVEYFSLSCHPTPTPTYA